MNEAHHKTCETGKERQTNNLEEEKKIFCMIDCEFRIEKLFFFEVILAQIKLAIFNYRNFRK